MTKMISILLLAVVVAGCTGNGLLTKDSKRVVCHKGKTLYVDSAAFDAHIRHGDYGRACYGEKKTVDGQ